MFLSFLDSLVPRFSTCSTVLYCVCRGGGSIPAVSFCTGVLPRFCMNGTRLCCLAALHHPTGGWPFILNTQKKRFHCNSSHITYKVYRLF